MTLPPVVILCGGRGTRLREHGAEVPKPLVEIGGRPILWHVMQLYIAQGAGRFVLCAGYKCELIAAFAAEWPEGSRSSASTPGSTRRPAGASTACATGCDEPFMATYADGLADLDFASLWRFQRHDRHGDCGAARAAVRRRGARW